MIILGIETSCDETAAAVVQKQGDRVTILSNVVASSASLQAKYGGVIPEQAAREQIKSIIPVIEEALNQAFPKERLPRRSAPRNDGSEIDAIAVTYGPGLIGSLLVGVETAKTLATVWKKPLVPVNHLLGHFYANWVNKLLAVSHSPLASQKPARNATHSVAGGRTAKSEQPAFPAIGLLVSGGHTDLVLFPKERSSASFTSHRKYKYLGGTRDDAAGECFDKCARLLGLPYPGGPSIAKLAEKGNPKAFNLPRPMIDSKDFDFSFSGLKTAVANILQSSSVILNVAKRSEESLTNVRPTFVGDPSANRLRMTKDQAQDEKIIANFCASIQQAIIDVLVTKTVQAVKTYNVNQIIVAGGVAANQSLIRNFKFQISNFKLKTRLYVPPPKLCTDNAAMIASAAFFNYQPINPLKLQANPNLAL